MTSNNHDSRASVPEKTNWVSFASDITDVCNRHGIGIEGGLAYLMERDDHLFCYQIDDSGMLARS